MPASHVPNQVPLPVPCKQILPPPMYGHQHLSARPRGPPSHPLDYEPRARLWLLTVRPHRPPSRPLPEPPSGGQGRRISKRVLPAPPRPRATPFEADPGRFDQTTPRHATAVRFAGDRIPVHESTWRRIGMLNPPHDMQPTIPLAQRAGGLCSPPMTPACRTLSPCQPRAPFREFPFSVLSALAVGHVCL